MSRPPKSAVEPILPVTISPGAVRYAPGIRAGNWIFATAHAGTADFSSGISTEVVRAELPDWTETRHRREARQIFRNLSTVLEAGGGSLTGVVRIDQHYTTHKAIEPYHDIRREVLKSHIPPSTSTLADGLLFTDQDMEVHAIGVAAETGLALKKINSTEQDVHPSSGYSLALAAGDYIFVAGRIADSLVFGQGIPPEARLPAGYLWKGNPVKLETEFIVRRKLVPALEAAGSSLDDIVKCQVYLRDPRDFGAFCECWRELFPNGVPATTLIPCADPAFTIGELRVEINTIALRRDGATRQERIDAGVIPAFSEFPQAIRAGDLLFISGMLAIDRNGLVARARRDPRKPFHGSSIQAQMQAILENAESICAAAGTSLANTVRIQQFHTDLDDFYPSYQIWAQRLPEQPLPLSAVKVNYLPVPGTTVLVDLWVYVPGARAGGHAIRREKAV